MNFLKLTMIDTPSPRDADASKNVQKCPTETDTPWTQADKKQKAD